MSGEMTITPGKVFTTDEAVTYTKLNLLGAPTGQIDADAITTRERESHLKPCDDASNHAWGKVNSVSTVSAGATLDLVVGTDKSIQRFDFDAGGGAYTYYIDLDLLSSDLFEGAMFHLRIDKAASTNPTITVRNGTAGSTLKSINGASAEFWTLDFVYSGSAWLLHRATIDD